MDLIYTLIIGAASGWLAGLLFKGGGFGLLGNIIIGIVGSFIGFWLFDKLDISLGTGLVSTILTSAAGAIVLLFVAGLFRGNK
ncbi:MAG: GlsB/YeaQ/YmgE family stress response membrane protein [Saprospiraceae bacterium]|nr:GlsB/YeaQ/YmgE family stress response membrane protein [Saprospiraceae bacterium]